MSKQKVTKEMPKAVVEPTNEGGVKVTAICKKLGMDPKKVRARLRRIVKNPETAATMPPQLVKGSWTFDEKYRKQIETLIGSFAKATDDDAE